MGKFQFFEPDSIFASATQARCCDQCNCLVNWKGQKSIFQENWVHFLEVAYPQEVHSIAAIEGYLLHKNRANLFILTKHFWFSFYY